MNEPTTIEREKRGADSVQRMVSTTVLPPDRIKESMLKIYDALQSCKRADWSQAPVGTRMNAKTLINKIDAMVCCANDRI